jgi:cold-inducible RNA-binding protein
LYYLCVFCGKGLLTCRPQAFYKPASPKLDAIQSNSKHLGRRLVTMGRRLYVGNLPYKATDEDLTALFSTVGDVASARVMRDMATGRARGFGFVEMTTDEAAQKAIEKLHQHEMEGRAIVVNEAQPKPAGGGRGPGGGSGGGFNRGGGGGGRSDDFGGGGGGGGGRREPRW